MLGQKIADVREKRGLSIYRLAALCGHPVSSIHGIERGANKNPSFRMIILIKMQKPNATMVASYNKWQQLGRQVTKGETGISILAPVKYKKNDEANEHSAKNGLSKNVDEPLGCVAFKKVSVFDITQTTGQAPPILCTELSGSIVFEKKDAILTALQTVTGIVRRRVVRNISALFPLTTIFSESMGFSQNED